MTAAHAPLASVATRTAFVSAPVPKTAATMPRPSLDWSATAAVHAVTNGAVAHVPHAPHRTMAPKTVGLACPATIPTQAATEPAP